MARVSASEIRDLEGYADTWYEDVNRQLRGLAPRAEHEALVTPDEARDLTRTLKRLIQRQTPLEQGTKLYRQIGVGAPAARGLLDARRGQLALLDPAFVSTSTSRTIAQRFPARDADSLGPDTRTLILYELTVADDNVRGLEVDRIIDRWRPEEEVLLPPESRYVFRSKRRDPSVLGERWIVKGDVLAPTARRMSRV